MHTKEEGKISQFCIEEDIFKTVWRGLKESKHVRVVAQATCSLILAYQLSVFPFDEDRLPR